MKSKSVVPSMKALGEAASRGDIERATALLDAGTSVRGKVTKGGINDDSPLHLAAQFGHVEMVRLLHSRGAYLNCHDYKGMRPLHKAVAAGHTVCVETLLALGADVRAPNLQGETPLHTAASAALSKDEVLPMLIGAGALIDEVANNVVPERRMTPLALSISSNHLSTALALIALGANPKQEVGRKKLPIHVAASTGNVGMLKMLDGKGGSWKSVDGDGASPLELAARAEAGIPALRWLIEKGVELPEVAKAARGAALMSRVGNLSFLLDEYGAQMPIGELLQEMKCETPEQVQLFKRLLEMGALGKIESNEGKSKIAHAIANCRFDPHQDLVRTAIAHGMDANLTHNFRHPIVFSAAAYNFGMIEVLLENGSDPSRIGPDDWDGIPSKSVDHAKQLIDAYRARQAIMRVIGRSSVPVA